MNMLEQLPLENLSEANQAVGIAVVNGVPFLDMPDDLYIPPDALEVFLELFEGPLDLLLYLIRKQNLDILAIPIAQITRQYMAYVQVMEGLKIDLAAEYLVMSAWLMEIKSRLLLPRPPEIETEEEDPRAALIRRLQEYEVIKKAAEDLDLIPRMERDVFGILVEAAALKNNQTIPPQVSLSDILQAFQKVLKRADQFSHHQIAREPLSVRERMSTILEKLKRSNNLFFSQLFLGQEGRHGAVVTFLAILELCKEQLIDIFQTEPYAELYICLS